MQNKNCHKEGYHKKKINKTNLPSRRLTCLIFISFLLLLVKRRALSGASLNCEKLKVFERRGIYRLKADEMKIKLEDGICANTLRFKDKK